MTERPVSNKGRSEHVVAVSRAPDDPDEKKAWAKQIARVQFAMWVDGKTMCAECGKAYESVDDFIERRPRVGDGRMASEKWDDSFVDDKCYPAYAKRKGHQ